MKCPKCGSEQLRKNGHQYGKQRFLCKECGRQFIESYSPRGYSEDVKQICLRMYRSSIGFREIERLTGISHNAIINWVKREELLPGESEMGDRHEDPENNEAIWVA